MYVEQIKQALGNSGVYILDEDFSMGLTIHDLIEDSLTFISFFVEIENIFEIVIPDDAYSEKIFEYTLSRFVDEIIVPQLKVKNDNTF